MFVLQVSNSEKRTVVIEPVTDADLKAITIKRYFFNWKLERKRSIYKITIIDQADILGLMSVEYVDTEKRIEIKLLAVSKENMGPGKLFDRIAGNLFAFAARLSIKKYGQMAAISLIPKTDLGQHYMDKYGFEQAGKSLFMEGNSLLNLLKMYDDE